MSGPADIARFPSNLAGTGSPGAAPHWPPLPADLPAASPSAPGTVPQYPIPQAGVAGLTDQLTLAATKTLLESGAKSTVSVTLIDFATWADGQTIAVPGVAAKTIKKTAAGDIDVSGAADVAAGAAIIGAYMAAAVGSLVDYVGTVGQVMTFRAKAYGRALNGQVVSGTLLTAAVAVADGVDAYDGHTIRSEVVRDGAFSGPSVTVAGLSSAKRYRCLLTTQDNGATENILISPNGSNADCAAFYVTANGLFANAAFLVVSTHVASQPTTRTSCVTVEPRSGGASVLSVLGRSYAYEDNYQVTLSSGATATDFTSLVFTVSATTRTGWLTVIEETP